MCLSQCPQQLPSAAHLNLRCKPPQLCGNGRGEGGPTSGGGETAGLHLHKTAGASADGSFSKLGLRLCLRLCLRLLLYCIVRFTGQGTTLWLFKPAPSFSPSPLSPPYLSLHTDQLCCKLVCPYLSSPLPTYLSTFHRHREDRTWRQHWLRPRHSACVQF